jgi:UDP-N-acetylglucosamine 4,6-dehydratase
MSHLFDGRSVLITGGTGSFGRQFVETTLARSRPERLIILSRDELKQHEMRREPRFSGPKADCLRFFIGNVRDQDRLRRAFDGVDVVIHAAALKQVPACEYNPFEAVKTNIHGAQNIIEAAIDEGVEQIIALSTDKACNPINLYGATKLCSDKLFIAGNAYAGSKNTRFSVVRYGNVVGSRGSVVPLFMKMRDTGKLTVTHRKMTRFWITLQRAVDFVMDSLERMYGGELFVPKIPSMKIIDLASAIGPKCDIEDIGIRPGEKLHEVMISEDDARLTLEFDDHYVIQPQFEWWEKKGEGLRDNSSTMPDGFRYSSDSNTEWLSVEELRAIIEPIENELQEKP